MPAARDDLGIPARERGSCVINISTLKKLFESIGLCLEYFQSLTGGKT